VFIALGIQQTICRSHTVICGLPGSTVFFHVFSQTARLSEKKKLLNAKCVFRLSLQLWSETYFILRRTERDMIKYAYWSSCKLPVILFRFLMKFALSRRISEKYSGIKFDDNLSSGAELFHAEERTDGQILRS